MSKCIRFFPSLGTFLTEGKEEREASEVGKTGEEKEGSSGNSGVYQLAQPCVFPKAGPPASSSLPDLQSSATTEASETCRDGAAGPCALGPISFSLKTPDA